MALAYSDLPVTTGTRCFATYQNYLRSALIERAARVGAGIVAPPLIVAGDKIEDTFGPWLIAARQAVADILAEEKYGWIATIIATGIIDFIPWDLTGDGVDDGNSKNGILHYIHTYLVTSANNKFINDLYTIVAGSPIANISNLFCSENSDRDPVSGLIGTLMAVGDDYVAFKSRSNTLYGPPVKILDDERKNIFDNPAAYEALSQTLNSGVIEAGGFASTKLIDGVYFKLKPDGVSPINMSMKYTLSGVGTISNVTIYGRYEVVGTIIGKSISVQAYNYNTSDWEVVGAINGTLLTTNGRYQLPLTADHRFAMNGEVHIKFISSDENDDSHLYIDYCDVFYDLGITRFVRVKRTAAIALVGSGDIYATVNTYDEHQWMYYDHGELNPLYRTYFREIWFCIELMRYSIFSPAVETVIASDGKSINSDVQIDELTAWMDGVVKFGAAAWGVAPGGMLDSEIRTYDTGGGMAWVSTQYANRYQDISIPNPGADILKTWLPLVLDYYTNPVYLPTILPTCAWTGGTRVGSFDVVIPGRKRAYLQLNISPGLVNHVSKIPSLPTDVPVALGSNSGVKEFFESLGTGGWRDGVQDNIFVYEKSTFFDDPINPPVVPPP